MVKIYYKGVDNMKGSKGAVVVFMVALVSACASAPTTICLNQSRELVCSKSKPTELPQPIIKRIENGCVKSSPQNWVEGVVYPDGMKAWNLVSAEVTVTCPR